MNENPKIAFTRKVCRERKLRYQIKNDALFLYVPQYHKFVQTCFNLLNFNSNEDILDHIEKQIYTFGI
jgi:hypothetical protein